VKTTVGVTRYARPCEVCGHPEEGRVTAALLARLGVRDAAGMVSGLGRYEVRLHERECLPRMLEGEGTHS
jgi:ribosomal protein S14